MNRLISLRSEQDIKELLRKGRPLENSFFKVIYKNRAAGRGRLLLVVSKTVSKKAVIRNRLRRRMREWIRKQDVRTGGVDLAVLVKKPAATVLRKDFYKELFALYEKIPK
ncbi:MAG: ribonuclease P protein component [Patescibacteria group bacterium]